MTKFLVFACAMVLLLFETLCTPGITILIDIWQNLHQFIIQDSVPEQIYVTYLKESELLLHQSYFMLISFFRDVHYLPFFSIDLFLFFMAGLFCVALAVQEVAL